MKPRACDRAHPADIAGVGGDLGLEKHDVQHRLIIWDLLRKGNTAHQFWLAPPLRFRTLEDTGPPLCFAYPPGINDHP